MNIPENLGFSFSSQEMISICQTHLPLCSSLCQWYLRGKITTLTQQGCYNYTDRNNSQGLYIVLRQIMLNLSRNVLQRCFKVVQVQFNSWQRYNKHLSDVLCQQVSVSLINIDFEECMSQRGEVNLESNIDQIIVCCCQLESQLCNSRTVLTVRLVQMQKLWFLESCS